MISQTVENMQLTINGPGPSPSDSTISRLRDLFDEDNHVLIPGFLDPALLGYLQRNISDDDFYPRSHGPLAMELCLQQRRAHTLLYFLLNNHSLFRFIEAVSGCERIGCFEGRGYRIVPGQGHFDDWHNDMCSGRLVAISINLSNEIFEGGELQIRDRHSTRILCEVANVGAGDAVIFRLSDDLQHRIADIKGTVPKTAFAGWFKSGPDYLSILRSGHGGG